MPIESSSPRVWLLIEPAWTGPDLRSLWPELAEPPENPDAGDVIVLAGASRKTVERWRQGCHLVVLGGVEGLEPSEDLTLLEQPEALGAVLPLALAKQRLRHQRKLTGPLSAILGFARLALNTQLNRTQRDYLEGIFGAAQEMLSRVPAPGPSPAARWRLTSASGVPGPALRVLVADDNPVSQAMAVLALEGQGHEVVQAADGETVLQLVAEQSFDLVLMDVNMPRLDGYLTARALRERERGSSRHLPIVAVTAHSREGDAEMCLASGMDGYVAKPVREQELFEVMQEVLGWSDERPDSSQPKLLQREGLLRRLGGREDHLHRVIAQFLNMLPKQLEEVYQSFARGDHEALAGSLHRLKCSALAFESPRILEPISRLEGAARRPLGLAESGAVLAELRRELDQLKLELIEIDRSLQAGERASTGPSGNWPGLDRPLRLLLAEDNPINQTLVLSLLEDHQCEIELAENGQEALHQWQASPFDVILLDIQMPVMDGLEALSLIREGESGTQYTPVVVMTASSQEGDGQQYLQAGADFYLSKPIQEDDLLAALQRVLAEKHENAPLTHEVVDVEALGQRLSYKLERLARLSQLFHQVLPGHLEELSTAIGRQNPKELERGAQRYKTTLRSIEARRSFVHAQQLELMGREGTLEGSQQLLDLLCLESEEIKEKLDQLLVEAAVLAQL